MDGNKRLCDLPDAILIHILSFLPTNSAVSTSLLSRRWRYLWTYTPNLQLDESQFKPDRDKFITPNMEFYFTFDHDKFMNFAERVLVLRGGSSLVSFSLSCSVKNDESRINTLIASAIQHNVEQLSLSLRGYEDSFFLPSCIFGCQSLVKLDLQMSSSVTITSMVCLPRLKHLSLRAVGFADNESAERLLSHPMLEELILCNCTWHNITTVNVNCPKLQSLSIDDCIQDDWLEDHWPEDDWSEEQQVCFFGDNLKLFHYKGLLPPTQYCICGSTMQLRESVILVELHNHQVQDMDGPSNRYCKLLNSLSGVQNLTLSEDTAQSLYLLSQCAWLQTTFPVFDRVTRLNLKCGYGYDPEAIRLDSACLTMLYKRCPHLEHLNLMDRITLEFTAPILRPMPLCFRAHLKKVTLQFDEPESDDEGDYQNGGYQNALNLLFDSAPVLEEVVIRWKMDDWILGCPSTDQVSRVEELERELNARPKASENCRVSIVFV